MSEKNPKDIKVYTTPTVNAHTGPRLNLTKRTSEDLKKSRCAAYKYLIPFLLLQSFFLIF